MFFWQSQLLIIYYIGSKAYDVVWWLILFFVGLLFIFRESAVCKKYTNTNGKYASYTNAINRSIIWSCGSGVSNACCFIAWIVSRASSFTAWISSISATLFASFKVSSFIFFITFYLPLHPASTRFGSLSFVTFCDVLFMFTLRYKEKVLKQAWIQFLNILFLIRPGKRWSVL